VAKSPFLGATYQLASPFAAANRCVNLYPEAIQDEAAAKSKTTYFQHCPGFKPYVTLGTDAVRGVFAASDGALYAVAGSGVYRIVAGVAMNIATLTTSAGRVSMAENRLQLALVDGAAGYTYTYATGAWAAITDADFPDDARQIVYQDTYGIVIDPGTQRFYISAQNDFSTWDALDFASAEGLPDNAVAPISDHRELWIFGEVSTEVYYNSGAVDFPFERVAGATIEHGCAAVHSVAKLDNTVFWLGADSNGTGMVWRADGYRPLRVSTHAIEQILREEGDLSTATGWTYQQGGHSFYVLNLSERTVVFDAATGLWHERANWDTLNGEEVAYGACCHAAYDDMNVVGGTDGTLYELDSDTHTYSAGGIRRWLRAWRHANSEGGIVRYAALTLDAQMGVDGAQVMLRWSDDGGNTWSSWHVKTLGALGEYGNRAIWRRMGKGRDRVFEVSGTDASPVRLMGAYVDAVVG
jgi:hypothetical protein